MGHPSSDTLDWGLGKGLVAPTFPPSLLRCLLWHHKLPCKIMHVCLPQAMEERFEALSEEQGRLAALKEQLQTDKQRLTEVRP